MVHSSHGSFHLTVYRSSLKYYMKSSVTILLVRARDSTSIHYRYISHILATECIVFSVIIYRWVRSGFPLSFFLSTFVYVSQHTYILCIRIQLYTDAAHNRISYQAAQMLLSDTREWGYTDGIVCTGHQTPVINLSNYCRASLAPRTE